MASERKKKKKEKMQQVTSEGKRESGVKRANAVMSSVGKHKCKRCQAREKVQPAAISENM